MILVGKTFRKILNFYETLIYHLEQITYVNSLWGIKISEFWYEAYSNTWQQLCGKLSYVATFGNYSWRSRTSWRISWQAHFFSRKSSVSRTGSQYLGQTGQLTCLVKNRECYYYYYYYYYCYLTTNPLRGRIICAVIPSPIW